MSKTYEGKHKYAEVAEFVFIAMSVWDRQNGRESRDWNTISVTDRAEYRQRVQDYDEGKSQESPKDEREAMERKLLNMLLPTSNKTPKKEEKKPEPITVTAEPERVGVAHKPVEGTLTSPIAEQPKPEGKTIK